VRGERGHLLLLPVRRHNPVLHVHKPGSQPGRSLLQVPERDDLSSSRAVQQIRFAGAVPGGLGSAGRNGLQHWLHSKGNRQDKQRRRGREQDEQKRPGVQDHTVSNSDLAELPEHSVRPVLHRPVRKVPRHQHIPAASLLHALDPKNLWILKVPLYHYH